MGNKKINVEMRKTAAFLLVFLTMCGCFVASAIVGRYLFKYATISITIWIIFICALLLIISFIMAIFQKFFGFSFIGSRLNIKATQNDENFDLKELNNGLKKKS